MPIHEKNLIEKGDLIEKEHAVVDGVDVSGKWNTFIRERLLNDYNEDFVREVKSLPGGRTVTSCWQCGTCTSGCCLHTDYGLREFNPRYFIYLAQIGNLAELKKYENVIWRCISCNKCVERCPKGVKVEEVIHNIDNVLRRRGIVGENPGTTWDKMYLDSLMGTGVLDELGLTMKYVRSEKPEDFTRGFMARMAFKIIKNGNIRTGPIRRRTKGWKKVKQVADSILENDGYESAK